MNLTDISLTLVRTLEIKGQAFNFGDSETEGFRAKFKSERLTDPLLSSVGDSIDIKLTFFCSITDEADPFFITSIIGTFKILGESALETIKSQDGSYQMSSLMFPYLRNISKPVLESLGAADVEFPFSLPIPPATEKTASKKRTAKSTSDKKKP